MKITFESDGVLVKERVVSELTHYWVTESGAQVPKQSVLSFDRRGGSKKGSGRKPEPEKKMQFPVYIKKADLEKLQSEADSLGIAVSYLVNKKLGFEL